MQSAICTELIRVCYDYVPALLHGFHSPYAASNIFCFLIRFVVCNRKLSGHAYLSANFIYLSILLHLFFFIYFINIILVCFLCCLLSESNVTFPLYWTGPDCSKHCVLT